VASDVHLKKGQVVFRQGDTPKCCYIIVKGSVGIYIKDADEMERDALDHDKKEKEDSSTQRRLSFEAGSYYTKTDRFGSWVNTLQVGDTFGKMALLHEKPRSATVRCLEPCDLLAVKKTSFDNVIKASELLENYNRMTFFQQHVPGFVKIIPEPRVHPSYWFKRQTFKLGHCFLEEGAVVKEKIWVVRRGQVAYTRNGWTKSHDSDTQGIGDVFSSMSAVPFLSAEPFTVTVASDECQVFFLETEFFVNFDDAPGSVLTTLRSILRHDITKRLKQLSIQNNIGRDPMQSPRASGFPDWREAPATAPRTAILRKSACSQSLPSLSGRPSPR